MKTFVDVDKIFAKWNGKYAPPAYGGVYQCVAWAAMFSSEMGNTNYLPTPKTNGARDIYEVFASPLPSQYTRIANSPSFIPRKGDMVVWTGMPGNPYGHVSIASGVGDTNSFQSYDQNWSGGEPVHVVTHNYSYVLGVLRPKNLTEGGGTPPVSTYTTTASDAKAIFEYWLLDTTSGRWNEWVGQPLDVTTHDVSNSAEANSLVQARAERAKFLVDGPKMIADLQAEVKRLEEELATGGGETDKWETYKTLTKELYS